MLLNKWLDYWIAATSEAPAGGAAAVSAADDPPGSAAPSPATAETSGSRCSATARAEEETGARRNARLLDRLKLRRRPCVEEQFAALEQYSAVRGRLQDSHTSSCGLWRVARSAEQFASDRRQEDASAAAAGSSRRGALRVDGNARRGSDQLRQAELGIQRWRLRGFWNISGASSAETRRACSGQPRPGHHRRRAP
jgi:hypothetical protein